MIYPKFINAPVSDAVISEFELTTAMGQIRLKVIQVDVMVTELDEIVRELKESFKFIAPCL